VKWREKKRVSEIKESHKEKNPFSIKTLDILTSVMESPIVGTATLCFSHICRVMETNGLLEQIMPPPVLLVLLHLRRTSDSTARWNRCCSMLKESMQLPFSI
jgi:hypothetical protein